ncbi:hypothetical protein [Palleronia sediminis]|uniref:hypothetical protein n=1 Tax=Palleronia sediminis TaxID=2547833 RepID=UPI0014556CBD|nr:hypothetical protein [Palleronia sediminis]
MIVKVVVLFLVGMAVLAMFGRLRLPGPLSKGKPGKCRACGRPKIGRGPCSCGKG